jgi:hypothetical protein
MAKVRIRAPKTTAWLPQLNSWANADNLTKLFGEQAPAEPATTVKETTGVSDASQTKEHANGWLVLFSYVLIALGAWFGTLLTATAKAVTFLPPENGFDSIGFLALFFVMAQAVERLMEPLAEVNFKFMGSARKQKENERDQKIKAAEDSTNAAARQENADAAATSEAEATQVAANTKVFIWALASFVAMLASGATKVYFLPALGFNNVPDYLNILITGLVIGGGTKPLHDLIKLIEKKGDSSSEDEGDEGGEE